ncbi:hypothetical protein IC232_08180 [Microvirga sp. BT688]|uniref:hypothetical protein n=1 Tax=Microvirga sp. TaxID=1873136 RepID=UPI00168A1F60|nr:hypothetical protein [Microvirga sp.]MBD2746679.1 hypothetical protein [Microvirga sp.]
MGDRKMPRLPMTADEFLEWAATQEEKWELVDGYPVPKFCDETEAGMAPTPRVPMSEAEFQEWVRTQPSRYELVDGVPIPVYGEVRGDLITSDWRALYGSLKGKGRDPNRVRTIEEISGAAMTDDETLTHEEAAALLGGYATLAHRVMIDELPRLPDGLFRRGDVLALRDRLSALEALAASTEELSEIAEGEAVKHETQESWRCVSGSLKGQSTDPDRVRSIEKISGAADDDEQFQEALRQVRATGAMGVTPRDAVVTDLAAEGEDAKKDQTFGEALRDMGWQPVPLPRLTLRSGAPGRRLKLPRPPEEAVLIAEGEAARREILRLAGGYLEEELAAEWLGVSVDHLRRSVEEGTWIAVEMDGRLVVPACMMRDSMTVLILREILAVMPIRSPWMRLEWLVRPDDALGGLSPMEAIRDCREKEVRELARSHGAD